MDRYLIAGWLLLAAVLTCRLVEPSATRGADAAWDDPASSADRPLKRVTLGPTRLRYFEGESSLTMYAEMGSDRAGAFYIVYRPTAAAWSRKMPEWCRHRREEILPF